MPTTHLDDRALVEVSGAEATHFLQNLITADIEPLPPHEAKPAALLTPQGKILFDFLILRQAEAYLIDVRADAADDLVKRLTLYKLRAKVQIAKRDQSLVAVEWQSDSTASQTDSTVRDMRFPGSANVLRHYGPSIPPQTAGRADWDAFRVSHGLPESGGDYALADAFPHDALLDQMGGVGFRKGCYVGQEVVSRMQHRGTARRRFLIASAETTLPPAGTAVTAGDKAIGTLGTVAGRQALALVRIDRVKDALDAGQPIMAGEVALSLSIPAWASFTLPETAEGDA